MKLNKEEFLKTEFDSEPECEITAVNTGKKQGGKAMSRNEREALRQAVMETMEIMLNSGIFTNAAKRCPEDYRFIVSSNLTTMADSIAGRYERILNKVGD